MLLLLDVCDGPKGEPGRCKAKLPRWTYDKDSRKCEEYNWGGCDEKENSFTSIKECTKECGFWRQPLNIKNLGEI